SCTGTMTVGGSATCTITNNDVPPKLTLVNTVINNSGGTASPSAWTLSATGPSLLSGTSGVTSDSTFQTGTYALRASAGPAGYTASAWSCVGGSQSGNSISLALGDIATCTIANDDQPAHLKLIKHVSQGTSNDPIAPASAFTLFAGAANVQG